MSLYYDPTKELIHSLDQSLHDLIVLEKPSQAYPEVCFTNFQVIANSVKLTMKINYHNTQHYGLNMTCIL
jgi:hypothetical protein